MHFPDLEVCCDWPSFFFRSNQQTLVGQEHVTNPYERLRGRLLQRASHKHEDLAPVVRKADSAIHWINFYPVDSAIGFPNTYPWDSDLSGR